jgi:hypothetical protein
MTNRSVFPPRPGIPAVFLTDEQQRQYDMTEQHDRLNEAQEALFDSALAFCTAHRKHIRALAYWKNNQCTYDKDIELDDLSNDTFSAEGDLLDAAEEAKAARAAIDGKSDDIGWRLPFPSALPVPIETDARSSEGIT